MTLILTPREARNFWRHVSKEGNRGCWLWTGAARSDGYGVIRLRGQTASVHRVSFDLSGGETTSEKPCVLHKCDIKRCLRPSHLFAGSKADNTKDMVAKGRHGSTLYPENHRGENNGNVELTEKTAIEIRSRYAAGGVSYADLGSEYGVTKTHIWRIVRRKAWSHV
jgi:hypothetical protein